MTPVILKIGLPQKNCVTELVTLVAPPTVSYVNVWQADDNTAMSYPNIYFKDYLLLGSEYYAFNYYPDSVSSPIITPWNPTTKAFGTSENINVIAYMQTIIRGPNKLYFYGGKLNANSSYTNRLFEYDPVTKVITEKGTGSGTARASGCGCQVGNKVYAFSGYNGTYVAAFTEYDLDTNTFTNRPTTPAARQGGSMVNFNGTIYLVGADAIGTDSAAKIVWSYNVTTNTWTNTGHTLPTDMLNGSKWVVMNNELYIFNTSTSNFGIDPNIYKYVPGTGFTKVVGSGLTPALNVGTLNIDKLLAMTYVNDTIEVYGYLNGWTNGGATGSFLGNINMATNTITGYSYPVGVLTHQLTVTPILTNRPDDPELVRFKLIGVGDGIVPEVGYAIVETAYNLNLTVNSGKNIYEIAQPNTIPQDIITAYQVCYKSVKSEWGPWSNVYQRNGGA